MRGKNPRYKQGRFKCRNPKKYKGNPDNIIYRSGLELKYFYYCDMNPNIVEWGSEEFFIPYTGVDGETHRYYVDLWVKVKNRQDQIKEFICEIKPASQCVPPKAQKRKTPQYLERVKTFLTNQSKWDAAKKFAEQNNCKFVILTENDIKRGQIK